MLIGLLSLLSLAFAPLQLEDTTPPTVNMNAIHLISCVNGDEMYTGTGWLIGKNEIATANHVASGGGVCRDITAGTGLMTYKTDAKHDFAIMTGNEPTDEPYIHYTCQRPKAGKNYVAYGLTSFGYDWGHILFRNNTIQATKHFTKTNIVEDLENSVGMREYLGYTVPGMSGGPVIDPDTGYAYALVNAGDDHESVFFDLADTVLCR